MAEETGSTETAVAESTGGEAAFDGGGLIEGGPSTADAGSGEQGLTVAEPTTPATTAPAATPAPPTAPQVPTIPYRGRQITAAEFAQLPVEEIQAIVTSAEQFPHIQKKYTGLLEEVRRPNAPVAQPPAQPEVPVFPSAQEIRMGMAPELERVVAEGRMEPEFAAIYPQLASEMLALNQIVHSLLYWRNSFVDTSTRMIEEQGYAQVRTHVERTIDAVGAQPGYEQLKDPATKQAFLRFLITDVNPTGNQVTPQYLSKLWFAFKSDEFGKLGTAAAQTAEEVKKRAARRAGGESGGSRPATAPPTTPWEAELKTIMD